MSNKEIEALFYLLLNYNLTVKDFNEIVNCINKKIQEDKK